MRLSNMAAAITMVGAMGTAHANVVYNWQPISASGVTVDSGQLIFSDQAYRSGLASFDQTSNYYDPLTTNIYPNSPVIHSSLSFTATGPGSDGSPIQSVTINPREGHSENSQIYYLSGEFLFSDDLLTGGFRAQDFESQYAMSSGPSGLWTVNGVKSDAFDSDACSSFDTGYSCGTATGRWLLDPSTAVADVPEPGSLSLFMLAALGVLTLAWRRRSA